MKLNDWCQQQYLQTEENCQKMILKTEDNKKKQFKNKNWQKYDVGLLGFAFRNSVSVTAKGNYFQGFRK